PHPYPRCPRRTNRLPLQPGTTPELASFRTPPHPPLPQAAVHSGCNSPGSSGIHSYEAPQMEIVRNQREGYLELAVEGRLDGYWAQHLASSVGEVMREGTHAVRLN